MTMSENPQISWGVVIHGGAGTLPRDKMTSELEADYRRVLRESLLAGHTSLTEGGSALDAVEAAVRIMEDSPLFNAGKGSSFGFDGLVEMDAAIMDGSSLEAGAVAGVRDVKNPITLSRRVMEQAPHVFLTGSGAEAFARKQGIPSTEPEYFHTDRRWRALQRVKEREVAEGTSQPPDTTGEASESDDNEEGSNPVFMGTVGAVALDPQGNLAAATSTGGSTNKRWGRVGDSPIIGAGTYAGSRCAVSCTGWGEFFIRNVVAYDINARMEYRGVPLAQAADEVVMQLLEEQEPATGGVVSLSRDGHIAMPFNTPGMYRGYVDEDGQTWVGIYE
jgi:beta-aspartyl-peptidase (threonine type)